MPDSHDTTSNDSSQREMKSVPGQLVDSYARSINYLRMSVTDRCNLRCTYCMSSDMTFLPRQQILALEEMVAIGQAFTELGVRKIRLTGGEPLVRQGVVSLVEKLAELPLLDELVMTTNGLLLPDYAEQLKSAGLGRLNISIDSLNPDRYKALSRVGELGQVLTGIRAAKAAGFKIKLNAVILAGENDQDAVDLTRYAVEEGFDISFIEEMPLGAVDSHDRGQTQYFNDKIREQLAQQWTLSHSTETTGGPSRYFRIGNADTKVGFISPISDNFCESCNRVRLTAEGKLLLCLGNEDSVDLRAVVRRYPGELAPLQNAIKAAMVHKPDRHHFDPDRVDIVRFMNMTGG